MSEAELPLPSLCPQCDGPCPPEARFCYQCGTGLFPPRDAAPFSVLASTKPPLREARAGPNSTHVRGERRIDPPHVADPLIGRTVADRYRIIEQIGRGGMGVVYRVEHARIGKLMALKLLSGELTQDGIQVARFKREALMASRLSHPNTVQVFDFGRADGLVYLAMEYLRGEDLGRIIRCQGALSVERALKLVVQMSSSLAEAHDKGIVHRDLKPENIFVVRGHTGEDVVKVLDFGLAKLRESSELSDVTSRGAIVGTPYYMSPEQIRGENVGPQSDVYSLGALLYICLTAEPVFDANTPLGVFTKHLLEAPIPPHVRRADLAIPENLSLLVTRTLEKDPDKRPRGVLDLQRALVEVLLSQGQNSIERLLSFREVNELGDADAEAATRAEIERFEKKLRRRDRLLVSSLLFTFVALCSLGIFLIRRFTASPVFDGSELEPNDAKTQANRVPFPTSVVGRLGKKLDRERSDRDFYQLSVPPGTPSVRLAASALPNLALCALLYPIASETPFGRYCAGQVGRDVSIEQLALPPGEYVVAVMQDRDAYTRDGPPPVHENVSDDYRLTLAPVALDPGREVEPNDSTRNANQVSAAAPFVGKLGFMRDVDVVCTHSERPVAFVVEEELARPRPRDSVLQVMPLAGPERDIPVRIHRSAQGFPKSARDAGSPWKSAGILAAGAPVCLELSLVPNPWSSEPSVEIASASESSYTIHVEVR